MNLRLTSLAVAFSAVALLSACGGGGGTTETPAPAPSGSTPTPTPPPPPPPSTPPPPPAAGTAALLKLSDEAAGAQCASGGKRIEAGIDVNGNATLDAAEVQSTQFLCEGATVLTGAAATATGLKALVLATAEPTGARCRFGGTVLTAGADSNNNGALDAGEVTLTEAVCHAAIQWVQVTGTTQQAVANTGYIAANNAAPVVVTLPASASLTAGDIVHVRGNGTGGWRVSQLDGQWITTGSLAGVVQGGVFAPSGPTASWHTVAASTNGNTLLAAANSGRVHVSKDSGATWAAASSILPFISSAISGDGTKMIAGTYGGQLHLSTNGGDSFSAVEQNRIWSGLAMSTDGTRLAATAEGGTIYVSTDGGTTWTSQGGVFNWSGIAMSSDGMKLVAAANTNFLYTSTDGGVTWTQRATAQPWTGVASSADGTRLAATMSNGRIWLSTDSGVTWTAAGPATAKQWRSVAMSTDGMRLSAVAFNDTVWASMDGGLTWTARETSRAWWAVAMSADGRKVFGAESGVGGQLHRSSALSTVLGAAGGVSGDAAASVELEYVGSGQFSVRSSGGTVVVQ